jgi:hypothetical protein
MTHQRHLYDSATATIRSRQPTLFDPNAVEAGDSALTCCTCGRPLVRTESGYLCCSAGHGRLIDESVTEPDEDEEDEEGSADPWERYAPAVARRHAKRTEWLGWEPCECGACRFTRRTG